MALHWYKRYPEAALTGMKRLTLEERGAYNTVLDLIYSHDGALDDDDFFIAGWCSCDVRVWRRIKAKLIGLEKLYLDGNKLRNSRSDTEVGKALAKGASNTFAGIQSGKSRAAKSRQVSNGNNGLNRTNAPTKSEHANEPSLELKEFKTLPVTTRGAAAVSASASPDGPPRPQLPESAKWAERLNSYRPWLSFDDPLRTKWQASWGLPPDSAGRNISIPGELLAAWRAKNAAETEKLRSAA